MSAHDNNALIGRTIAGKYVIERMIGGGAMGVVFQARQIALDKAVAVKVLHHEIADDRAYVERFHREAHALSRLDHVNSIRVIDFGEEPDGMLYLVMELVEGRDLHTLIGVEWPFPEERIVNILAQTLAALAKAHELGIVHRDLKPENILIVRGTDDEGQPADVVKVCDFGIARVTDRAPRSFRSPEIREGHSLSPTTAQSPPDRHLTATGTLLGTPAYMSPEQAAGQSIDERGDIYSVGVILFQLLTGEIPFDAETPEAIAIKHITDEPTHPSVLARVNPRLEAICLKAMSKDPEQRYSNARAMRAELRAVLDDLTPQPDAAHATLAGRTKAALPEAETLVAVPLGGSSSSLARVSPPAISSPEAKPERKRHVGRAAVAALAFVLGGSLAVALALRQPAARLAANVDEQKPVAIDTTPPPPPVVPVVAAPEPTLEARSPAPSIAPVTTPAATMRVEPPPASTPAHPEPAINVAAPVTAAPAEPSATVEAIARPPDPAPRDPPPTAAPQATAAPPADVSAAHVVVGTTSATNGVSGSSVRAALNHASFTSCYRDALKPIASANGALVGGSAALHLTIDDTGHVTSATVSGPPGLPGAKACLERAARAIRISQVDTGDATADATLTFIPN